MVEVNAGMAQEALSYNSETGCFWWKERPLRHFQDARAHASWNSCYAGKEAGSRAANGYLLVSLFKKRYMAHRLAFLIMEGAWPPEDVDHVNGRKDDNRWANLRHASRSENNQNMRRRKDNTSGHRGVSWFKNRNKWEAKIAIRGKQVRLGYFDRFEDACAARKGASEKYFGDFSGVH